MKTVIFLALTMLANMAQAQVERHAIYGTTLKDYGGYGILTHGPKYGAIYGKSGVDSTWCLGYSATVDLAAPTCILSWATDAITFYKALTLTGNQTITGNMSVTGTMAVTSTLDVDGQVTFGAAGTVSTIPTTGAAVFAASVSAPDLTATDDLSVTDDATILGDTYLGAAPTRSTHSAAGALDLHDGLSAATIASDGAITGTTLDTGEGANELYDMDQNLMTTNSPTFSYVTATNGVAAVTATLSGALNSYSVDSTSHITSGWYMQLKSRTIAELLTILPGAEGQQYYCSDCSPKKVVISTGTTEQGQFAAIDGGKFE